MPGHFSGHRRDDKDDPKRSKRREDDRDRPRSHRKSSGTKTSSRKSSQLDDDDGQSGYTAESDRYHSAHETPSRSSRRSSQAFDNMSELSRDLPSQSPKSTRHRSTPKITKTLPEKYDSEASYKNFKHRVPVPKGNPYAREMGIQMQTPGSSVASKITVHRGMPRHSGPQSSTASGSTSMPPTLPSLTPRYTDQQSLTASTASTASSSTAANRIPMWIANNAMPRPDRASEAGSMMSQDIRPAGNLLRSISYNRTCEIIMETAIERLPDDLTSAYHYMSSYIFQQDEVEQWAEAECSSILVIHGNDSSSRDRVTARVAAGYWPAAVTTFSFQLMKAYDDRYPKKAILHWSCAYGGVEDNGLAIVTHLIGLALVKHLDVDELDLPQRVRSDESLGLQDQLVILQEVLSVLLKRREVIIVIDSVQRHQTEARQNRNVREVLNWLSEITEQTAKNANAPFPLKLLITSATQAKSMRYGLDITTIVAVPQDVRAAAYDSDRADSDSVWRADDSD